MVVSMKRKMINGEDSRGVGGYEKIREERMRENFERMQKLGIVDLSQDLRIKSITAEKGRGRGRRRPSPSSIVGLNKKNLLLPSLSPRRSSRLQNTTTVTYAEISVKEEKNSKKRVFFEGEREEIYTDEHSKLLGSCKTAWVLFVDGYGKDGRRIYDQIKGKTCHQCRQKTLGLHTHCIRCNLVQGQFCGDCLYMRYGENVLEVKKDPNWTCPVCRDICNCSICRAKKGWPPTGSFYRKALSLGFKSVAHYLIQTRRCQSTSGDSKNVSHSELVDINSNSENQKSLALNGTNDSNHPEELVDHVNVDAFESEKSEPEDERSNAAIPCGESSKTKAPPLVASLDSIASRLRKKISKPSFVQENDNSFPGSVKPCEEGERTKKEAAVTSVDCIASRLRKRL